MTRKDYQRIAEVLNTVRVKHGIKEVSVFPKAENYTPEKRGTKEALLNELVMYLADAFAEDNTRFNYQRFSDACNNRK